MHMSKRELIDAILKHNRSAAPEFLARFNENDLKAYLERMSIITSAPRGDYRVRTAVDSRQALVLA
jgi:hypothetical protein